MQGQPGFGAALRRVAAGLLGHLRADAVVLVAREIGSGRSVVWKAEPVAGQPTSAVIRVSHHTDQAVDSYLFPAQRRRVGRGPGRCRGEKASRTVLALAHEGQALSGTEWNGPAAFWKTHGAGAVAAVAVGFGGQWKGRAFVLRDRPFRAAELRFLHRAFSQIVPRCTTATFCGGRRRASAPPSGAGSRASFATGWCSRSAASAWRWRRRGRASRTAIRVVDAQLQRIETLLGVETESVRALVQQIRPFDAAPDQVLDAFRQIVERFGRETGIASRFWSDDVDEVYLPPKTARELARALQEALANAHKHSGARQVDVRFSGDDCSWRLAIFNDGRPFGFQGALHAARPRRAAARSEGDESAGPRDARRPHDRVVGLGRPDRRHRAARPDEGRILIE